MKKSLKQYMRSGDKNHFPSDGGVFEKIFELKDRKLINRYQKIIGKILEPEIEKFLNDAKGQQQKVEKCINIDDYLAMTKQDIYGMGRKFVFPFAEQIIVDGNLYHSRNMEKELAILGLYIDRSVWPIVSDYTRDIYAWMIPPLPIEYIYVLKQLFFEKYIDTLCPRG